MNSIVVTIPFERINKVGNKVGKKVGDKRPLNSRKQYIIFKRKWVYRAGWLKKGRILESVIVVEFNSVIMQKAVHCGLPFVVQKMNIWRFIIADERTEKQKVQEITDRWKADSRTRSTGK